ncbi:hypothetical protein EYZ11_005301 [Aspergillus tanneri]|uniref:Transcription factor domain-containing protein n=1 Tax=Aspergillus tanneri TaxID=1220188 RepID=A0A4V3UPH3_9EURO|nr:hypothetical protein EYZ11_005301 [Aspergillus tanneri]
MSLHRANSYTGLPQAEQQMRCRVLWLLFVTERGVCILHKLPVVLKTNVSTPELDAGGEPLVLPAFLKLLNLFRLFEQSKMFDIIESDQLEMPSIPGRGNVLDRKLFDALDACDFVEDLIKQKYTKLLVTSAYISILSCAGGKGTPEYDIPIAENSN